MYMLGKVINDFILLLLMFHMHGFTLPRQCIKQYILFELADFDNFHIKIRILYTEHF